MRIHPLELIESAVEDRQRTIVRVLGRLIRMRSLFAPILIVFTLWIGMSDEIEWRRILMLGVASMMSTLTIYDIVRHRRRIPIQIAGVKIQPHLIGVAVVQHVVIFSTGGMASPVVPMILVSSVLTGLLADRGFAWRMVMFVHLPALWLTAAVQLSGLVELTPNALAWPDGRTIQPPAATVVVALLMSMATTVTTVFSTLTAAGLSQMVGDALRARDSALDARNQQAQELTTLSGEIAHELKNPLASVKGLAQLVSRELERDQPDGKSAERMKVLRREVDRMQTILDEFLNFSRPLVPLNQREVELAELVAHVVDLHEGVASERRVELRANGRARVVCDPRKVEQILINLVQNALEVAPPGSVIELDIVDVQPPGNEGDSDYVRIEIRDRGPGLDDSIRARVFEPGVTGKSGGSGLGLTIARALARQHGGELELADREATDRRAERGCEARLSLPSQSHSQSRAIRT